MYHPVFCRMREHTSDFLKNYCVCTQENAETSKKRSACSDYAWTRMSIYQSILGRRFEHTYFLLHIFFTTRLYTYIKTINKRS